MKPSSNSRASTKISCRKTKFLSASIIAADGFWNTRRRCHRQADCVKRAAAGSVGVVLPTLSEPTIDEAKELWNVLNGAAALNQLSHEIAGQIVDTQPTLSAALAACGVNPFAKRKSASRPSSFFLVNPSLFSTSQIERVGSRWLRKRRFGASQGQSWGQSLAVSDLHHGPHRSDRSLYMPQLLKTLNREPGSPRSGLR